MEAANIYQAIKEKQKGKSAATSTTRRKSKVKIIVFQALAPFEILKWYVYFRRAVLVNDKHVLAKLGCSP
ncbi:hypothetical protein [Nostoc sp.]|uniref:hypothetical protein n=1 Tax=Nostoc sp. TaxID=1180 RepID=UPI002FFD3EEE